MVSSSNVPSKITTLLQKFLLTGLFFILLSHAIGILLPETGFDALWYHLPIVKDMAETGQIRYVPEIPQSNQPRLGEIVFLPWFVLMGATGVKICAYLLMLVLLFEVFTLAKSYLPSLEALLITLLIASFHTVAWQASSGYVDILRTVFELGILILVSRKKQFKFEVPMLAGLLVVALMTKLVTLLFVPAFLILIFLKRGKMTAVTLGIVTAVTVVLARFPLSFFFSTGRELIGIGELISSIKSLVLLPIELSFHAESYTTALFIFSVPFLVWNGREMWRLYRDEILFLTASLCTWVFIVPISVRYDLSAIILAAILCYCFVSQSVKNDQFSKTVLVFFIAGNILLNMAVRAGVIIRSLPYLIGTESQAEYLSRFNHGILKGPLEKWYNQ